MNEQRTRAGGYTDAREAERLVGHYLLALAILGHEDASRLELARMRVAQRRRERMLERAEAAELVG